MREDIGTIIAKLREKEGYTQEQVCEKICSISHLAKIEQNISVPDPFLLDRLLGRLGKSAEWLEYILSKESYELYKFQYQIQKAVLYHKFEEAESLLKLYAEKKQADKPIHRQFIKQEKAQIMWMRDGETTEILDCLDAGHYGNSAIKFYTGKENGVECGRVEAFVVSLGNLSGNQI